MKYGFILKGSGYKIEKREINSPTFKTTVYAVSTYQDALKCAESLIKETVDIIEFCGGFSEDEITKIISTLNTTVPVGHVTFRTTEQEKLEKRHYSSL